MKKLFGALALLLLSQVTIFAQKPKTLDAAEILHKLQKLQTVGSVMYIAAHPDDENTTLISYFSNALNLNTTYLSLTRGDGGQNLIGPEIRELLGVIRSQELIAARSIDGGQQRFSRANDFGFSKHPDETLKIWNKEEVLKDVVLAIRQHQPDIIINRFDHRTPGKSHGHHTASAMLSVEAFDIVNQANQYPELNTITKPWQPKRLFFNTSWWFYGSRENFKKADKSRLVAVDAGVYYPLLGASNTEISAHARSQHKCQGFGRVGVRGKSMEYLELIKGDLPQDRSNPLDGIDLTWTRFDDGAAIAEALRHIEENYDFQQPHKSIPALAKVFGMIKNVKNDHWRNIKLKECAELIAAMSGLYIDARSEHPYLVDGQNTTVNLEVINRSSETAQINEVRFFPTKNYQKDSLLQVNLTENESLLVPFDLGEPTYLDESNPYWLKGQATLGMYHVDHLEDVGKPESDGTIPFEIDMTIAGQHIVLERSVVFRKSDPVLGEVYEPLYKMPKVSVNIADPSFIFGDDQSKSTVISVRNHIAPFKGKVHFSLPKGWQISPAMVDLDLEKITEKRIDVSITPPTGASEGMLKAWIEDDQGKTYQQQYAEINYDHIKKQRLHIPAEAKVLRMDIKRAGDHIGYVKGAGDAIPASLRQIGYNVTELDDAQILSGDLSKYDAIVLGVRALNTEPKIDIYMDKLLAYTKNGGTLILQYNTGHRLKTKNYSPYPLKISRDRVTVEEAPIKILASDHAVLNYPNKITSADFDGWVQERGLYFPNEWDDAYTPILSSADPGEPDRNGGLLVAKYGKGHYIYSGYSWFRQLPAGVSGAYRLFVNLLSVGAKDEK